MGTGSKQKAAGHLGVVAGRGLSQDSRVADSPWPRVVQGQALKKSRTSATTRRGSGGMNYISGGPG
jgi:hypothetical protein